MEYVVFVILTYLFCCLNFSHIYLNKYKKDSERAWTTHIGSSFIWKNHSRIASIIIFLGDSILKGFLPIFLAKMVFDFTNLHLLTNFNFGDESYLILIVLFQVLGNNWSIFLKFKGGRGMAIVVGSLLGVHFVLASVLYALYFIIYIKVKDGGPSWIISLGIATFISIFFSYSIFACYLISLFLIILKRITGNSISKDYRIIKNRLIFDRDE